MKGKAITGFLLGLILCGIAGEAWRRVIVRPHPIYVSPKSKPRVIYYRYPAIKTVYAPPPYPVHYWYPLPTGEAEEIEIEVEVDD